MDIHVKPKIIKHRRNIEKHRLRKLRTSVLKKILLREWRQAAVQEKIFVNHIPEGFEWKIYIKTSQNSVRKQAIQLKKWVKHLNTCQSSSMDSRWANKKILYINGLENASWDHNEIPQHTNINVKKIGCTQCCWGCGTAATSHWF